MIRGVSSLSPLLLTHTFTGIVNSQCMLNSGDHGVRTLNYSSRPICHCAYTILSPFFICISTNTEFTHFDHTCISLHVCDALPLQLSTSMTVSSQSVFQCLCLFWLLFFFISPAFPQHLLPSCPCLLPLCSVSWTLSPRFHLLLFEG